MVMLKQVVAVYGFYAAYLASFVPAIAVRMMVTIGIAVCVEYSGLANPSMI